MANYTYTISTSFTTNGKVDCAKFEKEVEEDSIITTSVANSSADYDDDEFKINFGGTPSSAELAQLVVLMAAHDGEPEDTHSSELEAFVDGNAIVTDPYTGIFGPFRDMQAMINRRELFNDVESPLYVEGFVALNPAVSNLNAIHAKTGWHYREILKMTYRQPKDILFYYGYPNSFNSGVNGWDNEKVAQDMAKYGVIVFGDGVQDPGHADYSNLLAIVARVKALRPDVLIFGYVTANQDQTPFTTKVGQWDTVGAHGIFMDEAGYDFGVTRETFNTYLDLVHSQTSANKAFANAWNINHVLGTENDASYPNSTYNPSAVESNLGPDDYYLIESFAVNTESYSASNPDGYEPIADLQTRIANMCSKRDTYGVNMVGVAVIANGETDAQDFFDFAYTAALMAALDVFGSSDAYYGASSSAVSWWTRPDTNGLGEIYCMYPSIQVDANDDDVLIRITGRAKFLLDFSVNAQLSSITKY